MKLQERNISFDDLFELLENNLISDSIDKKITEKILDAETDWNVNLYDLKDFIDSLKKEINNDLTKKNIKSQINFYLKDGFKNSAWNVESLETLIEIFDYSGYSDLEKIFNGLSDKLVPLLKNKESFLVNVKGFPIIKILDDKFQIKGISDINFKTFNYTDIKSIRHYNPNNDSFFMKMYSSISLAGRIFSKDDNWILKINLRNGGDWKYKISHLHNDKFSKALRLIKNKLD
tara:strand:- start:537 stop:1232 length:696 start_codon:yes stop_codon:yes gene_type:complete